MRIEQFNLLYNKTFEETPISPEGTKSLDDFVLNLYRSVIQRKHSNFVHSWPIFRGHNRKIGRSGEYSILIYKDTGSSSMRLVDGLGDLSSLFSNHTINEANLVKCRPRLTKHFDLTKKDLIFIIKSDHSNLEGEILFNVKSQELFMNLRPIKIFLSHKSIDKSKVREFKNALELLGFQPWLDEDAMNAGAPLERALLGGMEDSCAVVFFITPDYIDENYLSSEIDYAQRRKREDPNFAIITLNFEKNGEKGEIPKLLKSYVWKNPTSDLEALQEILKALPIQVGEVFFK